MKIGKYITDPKKQETIIKTFLWKTIIDIFHNEKNINITAYLISIKFVGKKILIKTSKSIISAELQLINESIKKDLRVKLSNLGLKFEFEDIIYK